MIRRFLSWLRPARHEWQPTGYTYTTERSYDYGKATAGRLAALHRQAERRRLEAGRTHKADVIQLDSRRKAGR